MPKEKTLSVDQTLRRAKTLARKGELDYAAQVYRTVLEKFPRNRPALEGLEAIERAKSDEKRITLNSEVTEEQINGLTALFSQGRLQEALEQGTALEGQFPDAPLIQHFIGAVNARMGRWDEAIARYTKSLRIHPDNPEVHYNLGVAFAALNRHEEAVASATKALELDNASLERLRGNVVVKADERVEDWLTKLSEARRSGVLARRSRHANTNTERPIAAPSSRCECSKRMPPRIGGMNDP